MTDFEHIVRAERGEVESFHHLYERYRELVRRIARSRLHDKTLVDDVEGVVFMWLCAGRWRCNPDILDADGRIDRFVATLACFAVGQVDYRPRTLREAEQESETLFMRLQASGPTPEALAISHQRRRMVRAAVRTLPPQYQRVCRLHYLAELRGPDVAAKVGVQPTTLPAYYAAIRRKLRDRLAVLA